MAYGKDNERALKAETFLVDVSKKSRPKKGWIKIIKKDMIGKGLERSDAQDRAVWRPGFKTPTLCLWRKQAWFQKDKIYLSILLEQMDDDDDDN